MTKKAHRGTHEFPWEEEIEEISYVKGAGGVARRLHGNTGIRLGGFGSSLRAEWRERVMKEMSDEGAPLKAWEKPGARETQNNLQG